MDAMTKATQDQHEVEQAFAGAVLINGDYARANAGWLSPEVFTDERIRKFWKEVLSGRNPVELGFEMKFSAELLKWSQYVTSHLDVNQYAKSLSRSNYLRFMVMGATDLARAASAGNEVEIDAILATMSNMDSGVSKNMRSAVEIGDSLNYRISLGNISVAFGIESLDYATAGLEKGTFTILAGRPSMGKSSLAFQIAEYQALVLGLKVGFFALEMTGEQMIARRVCHKVLNRSNQPASWQDVRSGQVNAEEIDKLKAHVVEYAKKIEGKLFINDETYTTSSDILRTQMRERFDVVYIDHLGLLKDQQGRERYDQHLGNIAMSLHEMSKNTKSVVVSLAQLNRKVEDRAEHRPTMSDLQDSGKLEQNADNVFLMYRESYYDTSLQHETDPMEILIGKYRDGSRSSHAWLGYVLAKQTFVSMWQEDIDALIETGLQQPEPEASATKQKEIPF